MNASEIRKRLDAGLIRIVRAIKAINSRLTLAEKISVAFMGTLLIVFLSSVIFDANRGLRPLPTLRTEQMSPAEHLAQAKAACGNGGQCLNMNEAAYHISKIPASAPEHFEASKLLGIASI
jgi:hypothetical protein